MTFDMIREFAEPLDLSKLSGRTLDTYLQDDGYWHASVAFQAPDGGSIIFTTTEHVAGHWFEVFPIQYAIEASPRDGSKKPLTRMTIATADPLWRVEWIEPGAVGPTLGSSGNTQYAGRGPAPPHAVSVVRVLAGVLLSDTAGQRIVVASSDSAPFNVEIAYEANSIDRILEGFEPVKLT